MANNIDNFITKYTLDPAAYVAGGQKVVSTTGNVISSISQAVTSADTLHGKVVGLAAVLGTLGTAAAFGAAAGLAKVTSYAIEQASSVQLLKTRFAALNSSFDVAGQKFAVLQALGRTKSLFGLDELGTAGGVLEEAGLNLTRLLPLVNTLGNALGGTQGKALAAANALRNIAEGADPTRTLRQFGINASDFRSVGGVFTRNGKLVKDSEATFSEIEAIIKRKFGGVDAYLENTFSRRVAGLKNSFDVAASAFGTGFLSAFGKVADTVGKFFGYLSDQGIAESVGKKLAGGLDALLGKGDFFNKAISLGVATLERLPAILSAAWKGLVGIGTTLKTLFLSAVDGIGQFLHDVINRSVGALYSGLNSIRHTAGDLLKTASTIVGLIPGQDPLVAARLYGQGARLLSPHNDLRAPRFFEDANGANTLTAAALQKSIGTFGKWAEPQVIADIFNRGRALYHGFPGMAAATLAAPESPLNRVYTNASFASVQRSRAADALANPHGFFTRLYEPLQQIAEATKITAENTGRDLRKYALGGGPLGQLGVTPVEFQAFRKNSAGSSNNAPIRVQIDGRGQIEDWFEEIANRVLMRAVQQGIVQTGGR